jgi:serine/threonine protein kinase
MRIGEVLADRFVVERPLGSGGMGAVFLATDRRTGERVALKVIDATDESAVERFRREARLLAGLSHPGIVRYVDHGDTAEGAPYLAMEWLDGESLGQRLSRGGFGYDESIRVFRSLCEAVSFAHARGIVHRDIKPSNLFLVRAAGSDRVKVLDFGIARASFSTRRLTLSGTMLGTIGYMAPEQVMRAQDVDARADVFALGCVLFECLTGRSPFHGDHAVAILAKVLRADPPRIGSASCARSWARGSMRSSPRRSQRIRATASATQPRCLPPSTASTGRFRARRRRGRSPRRALPAPSVESSA